MDWMCPPGHQAYTFEGSNFRQTPHPGRCLAEPHWDEPDLHCCPGGAPAQSAQPAPTVSAIASTPPAPLDRTTLRLPEAWSSFCGSAVASPGAAQADLESPGKVTFPFEIAGGRHYVMVKLTGPKGTREARFHVDTGGNTAGLMLHQAVAAELGFDSAAQLPRQVEVGGEPLQLPEGASWVLLEEAETERQLRARKQYSVGQLGAGLLSRYLVCIDPEQGLITLGDPTRFQTDTSGPGHIKLFLLEGGPRRALYPFVHILLNHKGAFAAGYGALLDTGAPSSMLDASKIAYLNKKYPTWPLVRGAVGNADMVAGALTETLLRVPDVQLNTPAALGLGLLPVQVGPVTFVSRPDQTFSRMFGNVPQTMGSHGAIGNDVLNRYRLLIDYANARLFVAPASRPSDASESDVRVGLSVAFDSDGCPVVEAVADTNAAATKRALRVGDVLKQVGQADACKLWHHELSSALAGRPGETRSLTVKRGKQSLKLSVPVVDIFRAPVP